MFTLRQACSALVKPQVRHLMVKSTAPVMSRLYPSSAPIIRRHYHPSNPQEIVPLLIGVGVATVCIGGSKLIAYLDEIEKNPPKPKPKKTAFQNFYNGGFKDEMDRREAALILGCREHADPKKVRQRYQALLKKNHPDAGGSTHIAAKINEAKDVLLGGGASHTGM